MKSVNKNKQKIRLKKNALQGFERMAVLMQVSLIGTGYYGGNTSVSVGLSYPLLNGIFYNLLQICIVQLKSKH